MSDHLVADGTFINSIVGEGTRFRGDLELNGLLRIDGDYSGTISTPGKVLVGKNGRAECTIHAGTVVIGGVVKGDIYSSEKVIVLSTGMIIGNVVTPRLIVEAGVLLNGECLIRQQEVDLKQDKKTEKARLAGMSRDAVSSTQGNDNGGQDETYHTGPSGDASHKEQEELSAWKG